MPDADSPARTVDDALPSRQYAWAWRQRTTPEEKLLLLALCTGEAEPSLSEAASRTGLSTNQVNYAAERLHKAGLIDDHGAPTYGTGEQAVLDESEDT
jgi:hypothetical protein